MNSRKKIFNQILSFIIIIAIVIPGVIVPKVSVQAAPDDLTRAAVYTAAEGNIARNGTATAEATNQWQTGTGNGPRALNNGILGGSTIHDTTWNSLSGPNPVWAQIAWTQEQVIDSTRVMWACEGVNSNIRLPISVIVQYWDGAAFQEVTNMRDPNGVAVTSVGCEGTYGPSTTNCSNMREWNAVTFDAVSTTRLRLVMTIDSASQGTGIGEWEIFEYTGAAELKSASISGDNEIIMADSKVYTGNYAVNGLEGVTYEWTLDNQNAEIVGSDTAETVTIKGMAPGTTNLGLTVKHNSGVQEATSTMPITIVNISGNVSGPNTLYEMVEGVYTSSVEAGNLTGLTYKWSLDSADAEIIGSDTGETVTVKGISAGIVGLSLTVSHAASAQQIVIPKSIEIKDTNDAVEPYETTTAAGRAPILPRRVVVNDLRFDTPSTAAAGADSRYNINNGFDFRETFESSLIPVVWNMEDFTEADYAADKIGTTFEVTGVTAPGSRAPGLAAKAIIKVNEPLDAPDYNHSITSENVIFEDTFWKPKQHVNATTTFDAAMVQLENYNNSNYTVRNFRNALARLESIWAGNNNPPAAVHTGYVFQDTDIYKTMEGFAYNMAAIWDDPTMQTRKEELQTKMDEWNQLIEAVQYADGYIGSHFTTRSRRTNGTAGTHSPNFGGNADAMVLRYRSMAKHELYNIGHFLEAAVAYTRYVMGTGQDDYIMYEVGKRTADHVVREFGPDGNRHEVPGHEEIELAMMKWAVLAEEIEGVGAGQEYRDAVETMVDRRGEANRTTVRPSGYNAGEYSQDLTPLVTETKAVGHAVRAMYFYTGATDLAVTLADSNPKKAAYLNGIGNIYDTVSERNTYITGGLGSGESSEGFGPDYAMRSGDAYLETCSAIAGANWYQRLNLYYEDAKYADAYEKALYNGVLTGVDLAGTRFYYSCQLDSSGSRARSNWFDCACCPPNLIRTIANIGGYVYTVKKDTIFVNMYGGSTGNVNVGGTNVNIKQISNYPWEGTVQMEVKPDTAKNFTMNLRIPGWIAAQKYSQVTIKVDGEEIDATPSAKGYVAITKNWPTTGTIIEIDMPMEVRITEADDNVGTTRTYSNAEFGQNNKVAVERGPIVYLAEQASLLNTTNTNTFDVRILRNQELTAQWNPNLLRGVVEIKGQTRYGTTDSLEPNQEVQFIPYYAKNNRGNTKGATGMGTNPNNGTSFRVWFWGVQNDYDVLVRGDKHRIKPDEKATLTAEPKVNYAIRTEPNNYEWSIIEGDDVIELDGTPSSGQTSAYGYTKIGGRNYTRANSTATYKALKGGTAKVQVEMRNASNQVMATDTYVITVEAPVEPNQPPTITGPAGISIDEGYIPTSSGVFTLGGTPPFTVDVSGNAKITWNNMARKLDIAEGLTAGNYPVILTVSNGFGTDTHTFTLEVKATPPSIQGPETLSLGEGYEATSTDAFTITGTAPISVSKTSGDAKITWDDTTKKLKIAEGLTEGTYPVVLTAVGALAPEATITFTLTVRESVNLKALYDSLVLYYIYDQNEKGDANNVVKDYSMRKNHSTIAGTVGADQWSESGFAVNAGNYISIPTSANLVSPSMTLIFNMIRREAQTGNGSLFSGQQAWNSAFGIWMNTANPYFAQSGGNVNLGTSGYPMDSIWPINRGAEFVYSVDTPENTGDATGFFMKDGEKMTVNIPTNRVVRPTEAQLTGGYRIGQNTWGTEDLSGVTFKKYMIFEKALTEAEAQAVYDGMLDPAKVTYDVVSNYGTVEAKQANGENLLSEGKTIKATDIEFTATPDVGYTVKEWKVNGVAQAEKGETFTLSNLQGDAVVSVEFAVQTPEEIVEEIKAIAEEAKAAAEAAKEAAEAAKAAQEAAEDEAEKAVSAAEEAAAEAVAAAEEATKAATEAGKAKIEADKAKSEADKALEEAGKSAAAKLAAEAAQGKAAEAQAKAEEAQGKAAEAQTKAETAQGKAAEAQGKAEEAKTAAETAKGEAVTAKTAAETAATAAQAAKTAAETAKTDAVAAKEAAETAKTDAVTAKNDAVSAKTAAETAKTEAEAARTGAEVAKAEAESAKAAAVEAKLLAEAAQAAATSAKADAESAKAIAIQAAMDAEASADAADSARIAAEKAKADAEKAKADAEKAAAEAEQKTKVAEAAAAEAAKAQKEAEDALKIAQNALKVAQNAQKDTKALTLAQRKVKIKSAKPTKGKIKVTLKKDATAVKYQVQYASKKNFKGKKTTATTGKTSYTFKKLKKGTYYVRARAYTTDSRGKKIYSKWSTVKKVIVKK